MHYAEGVADWCELSLDPYFCFPRLWERVRELSVEEFGFAVLKDKSLADDCFALCAAIEMLTASKRQEE